MKPLAIIPLIVALLLIPTDASASGRDRRPPTTQERNREWQRRCKSIYHQIHKDDYVSDAEARWLGHNGCWEDGWPIGVVGP